VVTVGKLLDFCGDVELRFAQIYADYMFRLGSQDDRVAQFWETMSVEEWGHYVVVHFGRSVCARAGTLNDLVPDVASDAMERVLLVIEEQERAIRNGVVTLSDAFRTAVRFESSEADAVYLGLVRLVKRAIERLGEHHLLRRIERMESRIDAHVNGLIRAIMRLDNNPDLVREARMALANRLS
jgi:hypothetical protein